MSVRGRQETVRVPANPLLVTARKALVISICKMPT